MSVSCSACGYENLDGTEFCEACGAELLASVTVTEVATPDYSMPPSIPDFMNPAPPYTPPASSPQPSIPSSPFVSGTARLIAKQSGCPTSEFTLDGSAIIGRFDPDTGPVDVDLEGWAGEDTISRNHAEIYYEGGQWKIKDLGSTNGVFIKPVGQSRFGARITLPETLNSGDEIAIAKIRFLFQSP
ncbi:FHA domain-containing protein [Planktothrix tepida]|uniref:FHA domain-containing protein n=1 Tax=Planktothrix tepida PCC 9214 TaxID=671072 RepID=A0A1J1LSR8_9CYAN|nr:FHA domain-containing protein [Planktothrix tepida]CAD5989260.1 FHA domain-containing protein [Planktothrix tepida]CUR35447.1 FHA domain-containing protein [Planktothrix tepida PCC 9214]